MRLTEDLRTARATYERQLAAELREHAARAVQPPSGPQVVDLWAHLRVLRDDGTGAWVIVHKIIDLGWRPMGSAPVDFPVIPTNLREDEPGSDPRDSPPGDYDGDLLGGGA